jgi:hypothetical protein
VRWQKATGHLLSANPPPMMPSLRCVTGRGFVSALLPLRLLLCVEGAAKQGNLGIWLRRPQCRRADRISRLLRVRGRCDVVFHGRQSCCAGRKASPGTRRPGVSYVSGASRLLWRQHRPLFPISSLPRALRHGHGTRGSGRLVSLWRARPSDYWHLQGALRVWLECAQRQHSSGREGFFARNACSGATQIFEARASEPQRRILRAPRCRGQVGHRCCHVPGVPSCLRPANRKRRRSERHRRAFAP